MTGMVFNIQRYSVDDGDGIRTTVFLKGCPLHCIWCHNPESISTGLEIFYYPDTCIRCGACVAACEYGCHAVDESHRFDRTYCTRCGKCADACPATALERVGKVMSTEEVMEVIRRDKPYFDRNGGITISGGEPLLQWPFAASLAEAAKADALTVYNETCGYANKVAFDALIPLTDCFFFDIKAIPSRHKELTGVENGRILENLSYIDQKNANVVLRCPIIPGCNDEEEYYRYVASLARQYNSIKEIHLVPYHPLGIVKAAQLGKHAIYENVEFLEKERLSQVRKLINGLSEKNTKII